MKGSGAISKAKRRKIYYLSTYIWKEGDKLSFVEQFI